ncbi:hypothetical protein [Ruegeria marina]|uniref:hypothetical protein n=1 Tax=Ruegeria marina TaxID=639004 RepID=UPI00115F8A8F|nr:hypothetical protein [Ruegeria marina]
MITTLLSGCIESYTRTLSAEQREDLGREFTFSIYFPELKANGADTRPKEIRGLEKVTYRFRRQEDLSYSLALSPAKILNGEGNGEIDLSNDIPGLNASIASLDKTKEFNLLVVDIFAPINGEELGAGAGMITMFVLTAAEEEAFLGFLSCEGESRLQILECGEEISEWLHPTPLFELSIWGEYQDLYSVYRKFAREKSFYFAVDCSRFPQYSSSLHGFRTKCYEWSQIVQ